MSHHRSRKAGELVAGAVLALMLAASPASASFDVSGFAIVPQCAGGTITSLTPIFYNHSGAVNFTTPPAAVTCTFPGGGFSSSANATVAANEAQSTLSVSGTTSGIGSGAQANASLGVTLTLTPPPSYTGGPISVGFGSSYSMSLSQVPACVFNVCPQNFGVAGIGWAVNYKLNGQSGTVLSALDLSQPGVQVPSNVVLDTAGSKSGIGGTNPIMMDCCTANFTTEVGIAVSNGWSGSVSDPLVITVPSGWSYSLAPGPVVQFVPEPDTLALLASGLVILAVRHLRKCR